MALATVNATAAMANGDALAENEIKMTDAPAIVPHPRKFKASELPLPSATRSAIEELAHAFKKQGGYDETRKNVWEAFEASVRVSPHSASCGLVPWYQVCVGNIL